MTTEPVTKDRQAGDVVADGSQPHLTTTRLLLACGVLAGPLFVATAGIQTLTRDGFDLGHQPISLLSLGDLGWIQISNFVVAGLLSVAFAVGVRRVLRADRGRWRPRLLALFGVGLVAGGTFVPDPALGFPPGTPDRIPDAMTWHGTLHAVAPPLSFAALILACALFARRFAAGQERGWAWYSAVTSALALVLAAWPDTDGASVRLALAIAVGFGWMTALAIRLDKELRSRNPQRRSSGKPGGGTTMST